MTTKTIEHLQNQIEQLVREHLVAQRAAATAAVERAFASVTAPVGARAVRRTQGRRRPPTEVAGLVEQLYAAVRANPGELMTVIAAQVGQPVRALNRPMLHLKSAGRVRSAGQRGFTRYYPMTPKSA
jgi:acyl-CoA reductase-like NAD-dependent aldehyde dehydrogenase